jgi:transposase InsO family protein
MTILTVSMPSTSSAHRARHRRPGYGPLAPRTGARRHCVNADHGCQYTSWAFGQRLGQAGLPGSMGSVGDCYDNSLMESLFGTL